jgi:hypothetical protein
MADDDRTFDLREPLSERSRLIRRPDVEVGLLHDQILLLQPAGALACVLDEHAAGLWLECVGQPFSEVLNATAHSSDADRREVTELFRALRLFAMVGDAGSAVEDANASVFSPFPRASSFRFRGSLTDSGDQRLVDIGGDDLECTLELDRNGSAENELGTGAITILIPGAANDTEHELRGLEALTALAQSAPANPIDVLTRLVSSSRIVVRPVPPET